jgi:signal-transduction protein with cAMP-binding, CBS, and nucleotidyltransferase domain
MADKKIEDLLKDKKIHQIINRKMVHARPDISVKEAIKILQTHKSGYVVLVDENEKIKGIFTETDVAKKILGKKVDLKSPVSKFMTEKVLTLSPQDSVGEAIDLMAKKQIYHLPLVDDLSQLNGMLSVRTLIRFLAEYYPTEVYNLPPNSAQVSETQEGG